MKIFLFFSICFLITLGSSLSAQSQIILNIGTDDYPPYEFKEGNEITGFCTEIIERVLQKMEIRINRLEMYPWVRAMNYLSRGKIDALYSTSKDRERKRQFYYPSEELFTSKWVLFIRKKDVKKLKFESFNDLQGSIIGVIRGYNYTPEFWNFLKQEKNYEEVTSEEINFKKLSKGRIDYIVSEYGVGLTMLKKLKISDQIIALTGKPIKISPQYIIFSRKNITEEFVRNFSNELKLFKTTPQYKIIKDKYFLIDQPQKNKP